MLEWLYAQGLDLHVINYGGHSALHKAALKGHARACRWLIDIAKLGRRHMQPDADGFSPMTFATFNGFPDLDTYLQAIYDKMSSYDAQCILSN